MDTLNALFQQIYGGGEKKDLLNIAVAAMAFLNLPFLICSFAVAGTANAGFNAILTAILNLGFVGEAYYIIKHSQKPIAV